ncbi:MAG: hypothetical protein K6G65_05690 [Lachnospiraceae bacterium]|nr:hypothetical protein [Lachnospiraceae bacterium]
MEQTTTEKLLRECDAGAKMAISAIDEVVEKAESEELIRILKESKTLHKKILEDINQLLVEEKCDEKEPSPMAKSMSWMKSNLMLSMDHSDETIADLITDGCSMGIKSLYKYSNQYTDARPEARSICEKLIRLEETLRQDMRDYL